MYKTTITLRETQQAIRFIRSYFEKELGERMNLFRVSAPMFVRGASGLNDSLNEVERPVSFEAPGLGVGPDIEIVHSLAKWKRQALKDYGYSLGEGIYTNMNAIRRDEVLDEIHSLYVDQWDFEKIISPFERTTDYLKGQVEIIYNIIKDLELEIYRTYPTIKPILPEEITFVTSEDLLEEYPNLTSSEREKEAVKKHKAVFLIGIGGLLKDGTAHGGRAPDYDDWTLNGDILFYNAILDDVIELSSMGIRVDEATLKAQIEKRNQGYKLDFPFHKRLLNGELPQTYGGGIGQSRLCQFLLRKYHIGEVQCSLWPDSMRSKMKKIGVELL